MSLQSKVALVTGASRGIGRGIALELARAGAVVVGTATNSAGAESIAAALEANGARGTGMVLNVNDAAQCENLIENIQGQFGDVLLLVNNAGVTRDGLLLRMKEEDWDEILSTDLKSVYRLCRLVLRGMMKARFGRIVNISSVVGATGNAGQSNYAAAKAGLFGFSKSLAREVGSRNITVNCVAPGFIDTDMTRALSAEQKQALLGQIPVGRLGAVEDVAAAVAFLASDAASYITGATLHVNGGMHME
ncbi:MAG TPA: 3-oxoacyl-ACP reductase FabG [Burkholderiales bacterium]|nr:3-oxoacyl-ACP reductase FabG [Burkholderiales bacterium]